MCNIVDDVFGILIEFVEGEEVIIDTAEQPGTVVGIRIDSYFDVVEYLVMFQYGAVFIERDYDMLGDDINLFDVIGDYEGDVAWCSANGLRKI